MTRSLFVALFALSSFGASAATAALPDRMLLVVSGNGRAAAADSAGYEMDELAQSWLIFRANGLAVDIASPRGGRVQPDKYDRKKRYNADFLADPRATAALAATLRLSDLPASNYGAVMVIGGKGAMFDLPLDPSLGHLIAAVHGAGGVVSAVCHGPAIFARMTKADGTPFAAGRALTGFTDEEEELFGKDSAVRFPFLLEGELRRQGARFSEADFMLPHVVSDDRIVTGQNPFSVGAASDEVVRAMGRTVARREPWQDERSMKLVALAIGGELATARSVIAASPGDHDAPLIGIWGYYAAQAAGGDKDRLGMAIDVMELARPYFPEPQLTQAIDEARKNLVK